MTVTFFSHGNRSRPKGYPGRGSDWQGNRSLTVAALIGKEGFFNHAEGTFGDLKVLQALLLYPFDAADVIARAQDAAGDAADVIDQHVVVLGCACFVAHDALRSEERRVGKECRS